MVIKKRNYLMLYPHVIGFCIFFVLPFLLGAYFSVRSSFSTSSYFVGFESYTIVANSEAFSLALKNNLVFMGIGIPTIVILAFLLSFGLFELKAGDLLRFAFIVPMILPSTTSIGFFKLVFDNNQFSIINSPYAMLAVIAIFVWRNTGFLVLILSSAFKNIAPEFLDLIKLEGANLHNRIWNFYIPLLKGPIILSTLIGFIRTYSVFKDTYLLQGAYPNQRIYMLQNFMNNKINSLNMIELIAATNILVGSIIAILLIIVIVKKLKKKRMQKVSKEVSYAKISV